MRWLAGVAVLVATGVAAASPAALPAAANGIERVPVRATAPASFPPGLTLALASPARFASAARAPESGRWLGPRYDSVTVPGLAGSSSIDWSIALDTTSQSAEAAALAATKLGFPEDQRGQIAVPHVVGKTIVGTIQGFYVLRVASTTPDNARAEAALAFTLGQGVYAVARFLLLEPPNDDFRVEGGILPTSWNRGQAFIALTGVQVEGNFAPALVSIRAGRTTRTVHGLVLDAFRHRVVGAQVALERRAGSGWRRVGATRSDRRGAYSVRVPQRGRYRVTATVGATTVASTSRGIS
ncbi:MAG: carboxypeptidase-like regulatory domain-containing protein [Gaiellaceae bacterium]